MIVIEHDENKLKKELKEYEKKDLLEYAKEKGFSKEETEKFVENSLKSYFKN